MLEDFRDENSNFKVYGYPISGTTFKIQTEPCMDVLNWASLDLGSWNGVQAQVGTLFKHSTLVCADPYTLVLGESRNGIKCPMHPWGGGATLTEGNNCHGRFSCRGILTRFILLPPGQSLSLTSSIQKVKIKNTTYKEKCLVWNVENASDFVPIDIIMTDKARVSMGNENSHRFYDSSAGMSPMTGNETWQEVLLSYKGMGAKVYMTDYEHESMVTDSIKICIELASGNYLPFWMPVSESYKYSLT